MLRRAFAASVLRSQWSACALSAFFRSSASIWGRPGVVPGSLFARFASRRTTLTKKTDPHETLPLCSETRLGPLANDPEFDRKSLRGPPAKRSAKRSLEKVAPGPPKGVLGSIREPSGRSGSASAGAGGAPKLLWTPPGNGPDRLWSPRGAPGPPLSDFKSILR